MERDRSNEVENTVPYSTYENFGKSNRKFWSNGTRPGPITKISQSDCSVAGPIFSRGGWPRTELHYWSISQYASVNTISHAVRSSGEATEDPLKSEFLASFRCKCWTLNVIVLHNSSDYVTNTWWSTKTIKTWVFLRLLSPRVKTSPRVICQSYTRRWIYATCPLYILPLFNVYRYANDRGSRVLQLYASQPRIYSANESLNAISSERILLFTFLLMARKLYLRWLNSPKMVKVFKFWGKQFSVSLDIVQSISLCFFRIYGQFWWIFKVFESHRIGCHGNGTVYASFSVKKRPVFHWNWRKSSCERLKAF